MLKLLEITILGKALFYLGNEAGCLSYLPVTFDLSIKFGSRFCLGELSYSVIAKSCKEEDYLKLLHISVRLVLNSAIVFLN